MKKAFKLFFVCILCLLMAAILGISYIVIILPNVGSPEILTIQPTPKSIERGKYLANSVTVCMDCHSTRDWNKFPGPLVEGTLGKGGEVFDQRYGFLGSFYARNIITAGIVRSSNITPDKTTGIVGWAVVAFVKRFKAYGDSSCQILHIAAGEFNSVMHGPCTRT
ncbi:MAG: hypothetical protein ABL870_12005 [Sediminibacterium sp.]